jgi:anaerobic selenocysteine-containing dehydrogenase
VTEANRTEYRTCPLCEATCGLEITLQDDALVRIRGDRDDVFSRGFICPKGSTLKQLEADPDRLRTPLIRRNGRHVPATWDEAFTEIESRLRPLIDEHGPDAVAVYLGNPNVHSMSGPLYNRVFLRALRTKNIYSASTVDQMPKHVSAGLMFGHPDLIPVPDIDRTDYLLMLGANPYESNGSLATAPDWPGRMEAIIERGGKVVVIDPRRTKTAAAASEHLFITPGTDALLLMAFIHALFDAGAIDLGSLADHVDGLDELRSAATGFSAAAVADTVGIDAETIRRLAHEFAHAETAVVYGRIGTHAAEFGTAASWLVDAINVLTGNLDRPGGAMFPLAATEQPRSRRGFQVGRYSSRVHGLPEVRAEFPVATLADEITTPGDGRVRAFVTIAGNPVLSTPHSDRLDAALDGLDFMVSLDLYLNETSRHADVILPGTPPLRRPHYDFAFTQLAVRNIANYSPSILPAENDNPQEWRILLRLAAVCAGQGADADLDAFDDMVFGTLIARAVGNPSSRIHGRAPQEIFSASTEERGPIRLLEFLIRTGPYGDAFGADPAGMTLSHLRSNPHGIDLGPLQSRLPDSLATADRRIDLAPTEILADVPRLAARLEHKSNGAMTLVGRRDLRSNNSWMHNIAVLIKGKERCTLQIHPHDAERFGIQPGGMANVASASGSVAVAVDITESIMPGVVSLPHGWGHDLADTRLAVAATRPGVNSNKLASGAIDPLSGNAVLNGIPVMVMPVS